MSTTFKNYEKTQITNAKEKREALLQAWQILKGQQTIIKTFPGRNLLLLVIFLAKYKRYFTIIHKLTKSRGGGNFS